MKKNRSRGKQSHGKSPHGTRIRDKRTHGTSSCGKKSPDSRPRGRRNQKTGPQDLPEAFSERISRQFSSEHRSFLTSLDNPAQTSVRVHPFKWENFESNVADAGHKTDGSLPVLTDYQITDSQTRDNLIHETMPEGMPGKNTMQPVPWSLHGYQLSRRPLFAADPAWHAGAYYVQEASSQFLEWVLAQPEIQEQSHRILDACAAPGGKTTLLSGLFPDAMITANEVIRSRLPVLMENIKRWGTGNIVLAHADISQFSKLPGFYDLVLVDAPCSGEGLFRKDNRSRSHWSPRNARHSCLRQRTILMDVWKTLRPGGFLIYTTCTFNPDENERNTAWFLQQTGGTCIPLAPAEPDLFQNAGIHEIRQGSVTAYAFYPHLVAGEGFFLSVIRKPDCGEPFPDMLTAPLTEPEKKLSEPLNGWFRRDIGPTENTSPAKENRFRFPYPLRHQKRFETATVWFQTGNRINRFPARYKKDLQILAACLPIRYAGTETALISGQNLRPSPAAALDMQLDNRIFPHIRCNTEQARQYLQRIPMKLDRKPGTGWNLVSWQGLPIGWAHQTKDRLNNAYPMDWRLKKQRL